MAAPPDDEQLFIDIDASRLLEVMQVVAAVGPRQDYVHWDKLRHLTPPGDITREEWWQAIKMRRSPSDLALVDPSGRPFTYSTPPSAQRLLHFIDQHCGGEIAMPEVVTTDEQARHRYLVSSLMEEAIRSSQLEGATTSRRVAKELLRSGRVPTDRSELMILNNYRALEFMRDGMGETLTPDLVMTLQGILTKDTLDDPSAAGRLQTSDEERVVVLDATDRSIVHTPPPAEQLLQRMQAMCDFANGKDDDDSGGFIHPVLRGILLHFWLAYDHPFLDGNGRTARALFYWYMRTQKYWLVEYLSLSRVIRSAPAKYGKAFLLTETDHGDTTYFLLHQLEVIQRAVDELHVYLNRKVREVREIERLIKGSAGFNHRQLALLADASRHPENVYTYQSHASSHRVTHETARADLLQLRERGLLQRRKAGRRHAYSAVPDLPKALQEF
ncbi:MAG TPA: Fic family protein [Solirubrobacteraceae bacterium]